MIKILTDTACDMSIAEAEKLGIILVPIQIEIEQKNYDDLYDLAKDEFYEKLAKTKTFPKTSQPSVETFCRHFETARDHKDVLIAILLSSKLSGTIQSALLAKDLVHYDDIHIIDSKAAVCAQKMLVLKAYEMAQQNCKVEAIKEELQYMRQHLRVFAMVDTLEYLHRGGRLTKAQAKIGSLLNLKPIITINEEGGLDAIDKCVGRVRSYAAIIKKVSAFPVDENYSLYFTYSYGTENCEVFMKKIKKALQIETDLPLSQIGATVGTHLGAGTYGIIYISKN